MKNIFESPPSSPEKPERKTEDSDEEVFQKYVESLELTPADFEKQILDIGSNTSQFAKYAKEHHISEAIYSVDIRPVSLEREKSVVGSAETLPFQNESFDLVVSLSAIPNIYIGAEFSGRREQVIQQAIEEMIRVVRKGGEIRLGNIRLEKDREDGYIQNYITAVHTALDQLRKREDIIISMQKISPDEDLLCIQKV